MDTTQEPAGLRVLSLFTGIGGLDRGVEMAVPGSRAVVVVEGEAFCCAVLASRMETGGLGKAPIWSDAATLDGSEYRGCVDILVAGPPCQPASSAGKRRGQTDDRWLWPLVTRVVEDAAPPLVFLENVRGLLSVDGGSGYEEILGDLAHMGYDAVWGCVRASDAGAPHRRERVFVLAWRDRADLEDLWGRLADAPSLDRVQDEATGWADGAGRTAAPGPSREGFVADAGHRGVGAEERSSHEPRDPAQGGGPPVVNSSLQPEREPEHEARPKPWGHAREDAGGECRDMAHATRSGLQVGSGVPGDDGGQRETPERGGRDGVPRWPPGPRDLEGWARVLRRRPDLAPALPSLRRDLDGPTRGLVEPALRHRADRLRALGNAVVPAQAALALRLLVEAALEKTS